MLTTMQFSKAPDDFPSRVRLRVRLALTEQRVSAAALSRRLGWSQSYIAHRLTGRRPFTVEDLTAIAEELGIAPARLIADRDEVAA